jgi:quercetin dioxygenase-like cupin family protein
MQTQLNPVQIVNRSIPETPAHNTFGVLVRIAASSVETGGQSSVYHCEALPGSGAPPHRHDDFDELFYIISGELEVMIDGVVSNASAGNFISIPRGVAHAFANKSAENVTFLGIATPGGHDQFFVDAGKITGELTPEVAMELCQRHGIALV